MPDLSEIKKEPELESSNKNALQSNKAYDIHARMNLIYPIITGTIGGFLFPLSILILGSDLSPINLLFLDAPIVDVFLGRASSIFVFIFLRAVIGGVFGYWAYLILRRKKLSTVILGSFIAGLFGGLVVSFCIFVFGVA